MRYTLYILSLCLCFLSCAGTQSVSPEGYQAWFENPENGLVRARTVRDLSFEVKYLSPEFLALKDLGAGTSQEVFDAAVETYSGGMNFLMTIRPEQGDLMMQDVASMEDYTDRMYAINFDLEQYVTLNTPKGELKGIIMTENTYGLTADRDINLFFPVQPDADENASYELVFDDQIFNTGIQHFRFFQKDINRIPDLTLGHN